MKLLPSFLPFSKAGFYFAIAAHLPQLSFLPILIQLVSWWQYLQFHLVSLDPHISHYPGLGSCHFD